jgi:hypothetical protein
MYGDPILDILAIKIADAPAYVKVNGDYPKLTTRVTWEGYGSTGYLRNSGTVNRYEGPFIVVNGKTADGTSGGPIWNAGGIVGIINEMSQDPMTKRWEVKGTWICAVVRMIREKSDKTTTPPIAPPVKQPKVVPVPPTTTGGYDGPTAADAFAELKAEVATLRTQLAQLERTPGPAGKDGRPGRDGKDGKDGPRGFTGAPGKDAIIDVDALAIAILKKQQAFSGAIIVKVEPFLSPATRKE